ncbi:RluA family pseudouridine synthase [Paenibacillus caui]|uniref:RluA family pseudouridine synthase n=1 Tax=Paenibacillus caui TaxID=2873927 RepID=UPI001CA8E8DE|nr:RluA family pseudouridine synthase [Paenibacillus caui]
MTGPGRRRGEWLELMPGKAVRGAADPAEAAAGWLGSVIGMPDKLLKRLAGGGDIRLAGDRLRVRLFPPREYGFEPGGTPPVVLYEDDHCLVVHKPAGLKVHPDGGEEEPTLSNAVAAHYAEGGQKVAVRHIHRLDEYTSGPVLYAKNELAQLKLDEAMSRKEIGRTYIAWVEGVVAPSLTVIDAPIGRDRHNSRRRRVSPGGKPAVTRVEVVQTFADATLVRLTLETGRTHQIRVHMSFSGHPLIGDKLYGAKAKDNLLNHQALHGERLEFVHPFTGEKIEVLDPWPTELALLHSRLQKATFR